LIYSGRAGGKNAYRPVAGLSVGIISLFGRFGAGAPGGMPSPVLKITSAAGNVKFVYEEVFMKKGAFKSVGQNPGAVGM